MKVKINNRKSFNYMVIIIFGIILSIPLFSKNADVYYNQGFFSIAKGFEFSKNFTANDGRILTSFFNYLGTANTILEAPLGTFLIFVFNYFFKSYIISYKIIVFLSIILSGIYMHKYMDKVSSNKDLALLSALIYMSSPIHLFEGYINNSIDITLAFIFIPLVFLGLYKMFNTQENCFYLSIGVIGLILSDLKIAYIVGIAIIVYFIINYKNWSLEHVRKSIVVNFIFIVTITSFFIFPNIQAKFITEYVGTNTVKELFLNSRVSIRELFVTEKDDFEIVELGLPIILMFAFSIFSLHKQKELVKKEFLFNFGMAIFFIFLSTNLFPWGIFPNYICFLENPSMFLVVALFFECNVCSLNMDSVLKTFRLKDVLIISFISVLYIAGLKGFLPFDENISEVNKYDISKIYDYAVIPKKAKDNIDYIRNRDKEVAVLEGNSEIYEKSKMLTFYSFRATTIAKDTVYELPFLYYPGYEIRYDGIKTDYFESPNGMIAIKMDPEEDTHFEVRYIGTELMNFCKILSFTSLIVFCIYVYKKH